MTDDKLNFTDHITKTARSCRFALYNKKIGPFLSEHATQLLVQALVLSRLDYCNALLAGLPANSIKPLQLIQNAAARLIFNEQKRTHVTPLFINLHWLPIAARIKFKALMFAYRTTSGSAPLYLNSLLQTYVPSRSLRSASERCITKLRATLSVGQLELLNSDTGRELSHISSSMTPDTCGRELKTICSSGNNSSAEVRADPLLACYFGPSSVCLSAK